MKIKLIEQIGNETFERDKPLSQFNHLPVSAIHQHVSKYINNIHKARFFLETESSKPRGEGDVYQARYDLAYFLIVTLCMFFFKDRNRDRLVYQILEFNNCKVSGRYYLFNLTNTILIYMTRFKSRINHSKTPKRIKLLYVRYKPFEDFDP